VQGNNVEPKDTGNRVCSENELITSAINGDRNAFGKIVELYAVQVYNLSYRLTGNEPDAKDLSQEVFCRALKLIGEFKQESSISTWLHRIAVNLWLNNVKHGNIVKYESLDKSVVNEEDNEIKREFMSNELGPEEKVVVKEFNRLLQDALNELTPEQRVAFVLKYIEGKSLKEIAKICNCSVSLVGVRLARALVTLNGKLKQYYKT